MRRKETEIPPGNPRRMQETPSSSSGQSDELTTQELFENVMGTIISDSNSSLQTVHDSFVGCTSISCLKKVCASNKKTKKRKAECTGQGDKVWKDSSTTDLSHECQREKNVDELNPLQVNVKECSAFEKGNMEVPLANCKEEASPLPSGYGTSLEVVGTDVANISAAGCDDKELALAKENIMNEKNGEGFSNLPREVPDCDLVEASLESCSMDCQNGAQNDTKRAGCEEDSKQEGSLDLSLIPEKAPLSCSSRKLLILDLNGLLVDMAPYQSNWRKPDTIVGGKLVYKRPFCDEFLKFCFERFNVGIWTSRTKKNMDAVLNFLMRDDKHKLLFFWDQSQCTSTGFTTVENWNKPMFLKELKKIWDKEVPTLPWEKGDYTPSNTLLLDDSPYKALRNPPHTAIFPLPYRFRNVNDNALGPEGDLRVYLEGLAESDDVPRYVQEHPFGQRAITSSNASWKFYCKVIGVENSLP